MDGRHLDRLAVQLATGASRRRLLAGLGAGALAGLLGRFGSSRAGSQDAEPASSEDEIAFTVQPVCACPAGLVLCQGWCVRPRDCVGQEDATAVSGTTVPEAACPPQEQFCAARNVCVPCPAAMRLDGNCRCLCGEGSTTTAACSVECSCPQVASCTCACACPGPPCEAPKVQHADTCRCVCPNRCRRPLVQDAATCACVCPAGTVACGRGCVRCPQGATADPKFCDCVCETITVPTDGTTVLSTMSLIAGKSYTIRVSGTFNIGGKLADAEYTVGPTNNMLFNRCGPGGSFADIGLAIDAPNLSATTKTPASWGPYRPDHIYSTTFVGKGAPIALNYHDCPGFFGDNRGTLTVQILCPREPDPVNTGETTVPPIGGDDPSPTATATTSPTSTPAPTATNTPPTATSTNTPVPEPTATATPSGPPICGADELLCIDRCIPASNCPAQNCCFIPESCTCACQDCAENFVFDPTTCRCVCQPPPCPPGYQLNQDRCDCVCSETPCPDGQSFDPATCACESPASDAA